MKAGKLHNNYAGEIEKKQVTKDLSRTTALAKAKATKGVFDDIQTRMTMGDSPQVDESVMISFLLALTKNISDGFSLYQKYIRELVTQDKDKKLSPIDKKLATLKDLENAQEKMERYTALMVKRKAYEKRLEELKENGAKPSDGFANKEQEQKSLISQLKEVNSGLEKIYDAYDFAKNPDGFMEALNKSREKWFGVGASFLSEAEEGVNGDFATIAQKAGVSILNAKIEDVMEVVNSVTKTLAQEEGKITMKSLVEEGTRLSAPDAQTNLI